MSFVVQALNNPRKQKEQAEQLFRYLNLKTNLNRAANIASKEASAKLALGMQPSVIPTNQGSEQVTNRFHLRDAVQVKLLEIVDGTTAHEMLQFLDKNGDLEGFNIFFPKFKDEMKSLKGAKFPLVRSLWETFKKKIESTYSPINGPPTPPMLVNLAPVAKPISVREFNTARPSSFIHPSEYEEEKGEEGETLARRMGAIQPLEYQNQEKLQMHGRTYQEQKMIEERLRMYNRRNESQRELKEQLKYRLLHPEPSSEEEDPDLYLDALEDWAVNKIEPVENKEERENKSESEGEEEDEISQDKQRELPKNATFDDSVFKKLAKRLDNQEKLSKDDRYKVYTLLVNDPGFGVTFGAVKTKFLNDKLKELSAQISHVLNARQEREKRQLMEQSMGENKEQKEVIEDFTKQPSIGILKELADDIVTNGKVTNAKNRLIKYIDNGHIIGNISREQISNATYKDALEKISNELKKEATQLSESKEQLAEEQPAEEQPATLIGINTDSLDRIIDDLKSENKDDQERARNALIQYSESGGYLGSQLNAKRIKTSNIDTLLNRLEDLNGILEQVDNKDKYIKTKNLTKLDSLILISKLIRGQKFTADDLAIMKQFMNIDDEVIDHLAEQSNNNNLRSKIELANYIDIQSGNLPEPKLNISPTSSIVSSRKSSPASSPKLSPKSKEKKEKLEQQVLEEPVEPEQPAPSEVSSITKMLMDFYSENLPKPIPDVRDENFVPAIEEVYTIINDTDKLNDMSKKEARKQLKILDTNFGEHNDYRSKGARILNKTKLLLKYRTKGKLEEDVVGKIENANAQAMREMFESLGKKGGQKKANKDIEQMAQELATQ